MTTVRNVSQVYANTRNFAITRIASDATRALTFVRSRREPQRVAQPRVQLQNRDLEQQTVGNVHVTPRHRRAHRS
jgi:hypothetical protein